MRRVVVTGSESTGKTTLAARLAAHYGTAWSPEYARIYLDEKVARTGAGLDAADVEPIARGQVALEDARAREAHGLLVLDTDLVSTVVYATEYYGACPAWITAAARARRADLYLLCDVDVPWVADPQRDRAAGRARMHALFARTLDEIGATVVLVRGDWEARLTIARQAIDALLVAPGQNGGRE